MPAKAIMRRGHCSISRVGGKKGRHRFSAAVKKIGDNEMSQFRWHVVFGEPYAKFIHILIEEFHTTWISALSDMEYSFIGSLAARTDVFY